MLDISCSPLNDKCQLAIVRCCDKELYSVLPQRLDLILLQVQGVQCELYPGVLRSMIVLDYSGLGSRLAQRILSRRYVLKLKLYFNSNYIREEGGV